MAKNPNINNENKVLAEVIQKFIVADGKAIITLRGCLGAGKEIKPEYFKSRESFENYLNKGYIVQKVE